MSDCHTTLIDCATLATQLQDPAWAVIDCRFELGKPDSGARAYADAHIPTARYAHLDRDLSSPVTPYSGRHPLPKPSDLMCSLGRWGIQADTQVVAYDDCGGSMAARLWWLLRWLGHTRVAVLDGGWSQWLREGQPVTTATTSPGEAVYPGTAHDTHWLDSPAIMSLLEQATAKLIDVRAPARFRGEVEPLDPVAGHIPGSINLPLTRNLAADGRFLDAATLRDLYLDTLAGTAPEDSVFMCGSGVTACHSILAMHHAGLPGARLYAGSWSEWLRDPSRPVATGA